MAYNTEYSLDIQADDDCLEDVYEALRNMGLSDLVVGYTITQSWYDHEETMIGLSKQFPDVTFVLQGNGEEYPDLWKKRFVDGQVDEVRAEIIYPDFPELT